MSFAIVTSPVRLALRAVASALLLVGSAGVGLTRGVAIVVGGK